MALSSEKKIRILRLLFLMTSLLLMMCVIATPLLLGSQILPLKAFVLDEDLLESVLIAALFAIAGAIYAIYRHELRALHRKLKRISSTNTVLKDRLTDAFRYIGTVNVQLQEIEAVFSKSIRYPENRKEFKRLLAETAHKSLGIVDKDWMLIRIIDRRNWKTCIEHWEMRCRIDPSNICVSNRAIIEHHSMSKVDVAESLRDNAAFTAVCVFPLPLLNREERILMQAVAAEVEMLYAVFAARALSKTQTDVTPNKRTHQTRSFGRESQSPIAAERSLRFQH